MARPDPKHAGVTFADVFCGAGGLSAGLRQAGWTALAGNDHDPDAMATFALNFSEAEAVTGDIRERAVALRFRDLAQDADVIVGGPPCQGFSQVRNHARLIEDPKNSLYKEFVTILAQLSPKAFVMENVPGMAQMGVLEQVLGDLGCGGKYRVEASLVDAADFGVPQSRKRLVFVGLNSDLRRDPPLLAGTGATMMLSLQRSGSDSSVLYSLMCSSNSGEGVAQVDRLLDPWDSWAVTAEQALGDLTMLEPATVHEDTLDCGELPEPQSAYQKIMREPPGKVLTNVGVPRMNADTRMRLESIPAGGNYLDLDRSLAQRYLTGQRWGPHNGTQRLSRHHYYAYRRLHPAIWAWTLNTKADSVYHWLSPRSLSVREFARLQSFPDSFTFTTDPRRGQLPGRIDGGPGHSRYRQAGNAVPALLARAIGEAIASTLNG